MNHRKENNTFILKKIIQLLKLVPFFKNWLNSNDNFGNIYTRMFLEDMRISLLPMTVRNSENFNIRLVSPKPEIENLLLRALNSRDGNSHNFSQIVSDFIVNAAQHISGVGKAYYEIVYSDNNSGVPTSFMILYIPKKNIIKHWTHYTNHKIVNQPFVHNQDTVKIKIPRRNVIEFVMPDELGGAKNHIRFIKKITRLSNENYLLKLMQNNTFAGGDSSFDHSFHEYVKDLELCRSANHLGWAGRLIYAKRMNDFFIVYRYLKFERSKAILRESIINTLNNALLTIGKRCNFSNQILVEGIVSSEEISLILDQLFQGKIGISEAISKTRNEKQE